MNPIAWIIGLIFLIVGAAAGYFFHRYQAEVLRRNQQEKADKKQHDWDFQGDGPGSARRIAERPKNQCCSAMFLA